MAGHEHTPDVDWAEVVDQLAMSADVSRPVGEQIIDWLGRDFDGVIVFDESHAMQNAAGGKSERGDVKPSQQGRAGLRLQHALPDARVLYVSATGATASVVVAGSGTVGCAASPVTSTP